MNNASTARSPYRRGEHNDVPGVVAVMRTRDAEDRSDTDLLLAVCDDEWAFPEFYRRHFFDLAGWLFRRTSDAEAANGIANEAMAKAFSWAIKPGREPVVYPRAWIFTIARNELGRWRKVGELETPVADDFGFPQQLKTLDSSRSPNTPISMRRSTRCQTTKLLHSSWPTATGTRPTRLPRRSADRAKPRRRSCSVRQSALGIGSPHEPRRAAQRPIRMDVRSPASPGGSEDRAKPHRDVAR